MIPLYFSLSIFNGNFHVLKFLCYTVKPALSGHSKRRPKIDFHDRLSLNAGQKYCRMLQVSILQYFRPSLSYHLSLRLLFCLFMSGCLRQVLLYFKGKILYVKTLVYMLGHENIRVRYLRNRSVLAVNCCIITHCLEVSCKEDQITSVRY